MAPNPLPDFYKIIQYDKDGNPVAASGSNAVTIADGADVTQGTKADPAVTNPALSATEISLLKGLLTYLATTGAKVQGLAADGAAMSGNPVVAAIVDGSGNVQQILGDTSGRMQVIGSAANGAAAVNNPIWVAGFDGANVQGARIQSANTDTQATLNGLSVNSQQQVYKSGAWGFAREPDLFATVETAANWSTAIVTSSVSKKLRLLAYQIMVTQDAATTSGADFVIKILDVAADLKLYMSLYVPAASVTTNAGMITTGWITLGKFGILMAATNTALNVNLSAALSAGKVRVNVAYTEE